MFTKILSLRIFPIPRVRPGVHPAAEAERIEGSGRPACHRRARARKIEPFILTSLFKEIKSKADRETGAALQAIKNELRAGEGLKVKAVTRSGLPAREILKTEEDEDVSGVVMGSHESGWLENLFAGSVAEAVVHKSKRPVLVVKH